MYGTRQTVPGTVVSYTVREYAVDCVSSCTCTCPPSTSTPIRGKYLYCTVCMLEYIHQNPTTLKAITTVLYQSISNQALCIHSPVHHGSLLHRWCMCSIYGRCSNPPNGMEMVCRKTCRIWIAPEVCREFPWHFLWY